MYIYTYMQNSKKGINIFKNIINVYYHNIIYLIYVVYLKRNSFNENKINQPKYKWTEEWLDNVPIDHFSFKDIRTFKLRYLINTDYFKEKNAPIFFYTGNEGNIEGFAENTGFMFDIAPKFGAALIFAEHQKRLSNSNKSPVISFGGSYGGMLTAWMRIKYPHLIDGGIASSAPVHYFSNSTPQYSYYDITTRTFINSGCSLNLLLNSFNSIRKMANTENGRKFLNKNYHLSPSSKINNSSDGELLINYFLSIMDILATVDYPYPNNFLAPLPGWPVKVACKPFLSAKTSEELAIALFDGLNMFYNFNNSNNLCLWGDDCVYPPSPLGDNGDGWDWQACTEMVMLMCARGPPFDPYNKKVVQPVIKKD
ncbi:hypothetical protein Mgra_00008438 [Meloidogyne graminicola]|uniref:Uncharacterized protein n=1 Tax=Meloidogyne graminicola TaxID=189291 RepID=A0A8S9ZFX9_9BILA|nr:hypothetical protein Mgra_00008438 [Meloidogyne graminicola]